MDAAIQSRNRLFPVALVAALMALLLGAGAGYLLKPTTIVPGPARTIYIPAETALPSADACIFVNHHKGC